MKKNSFVFIVILFIIIGVLIYFLPDIYKKFQNMDVPKIENKKEEIKEEVKKEKISIDSDIVKNITLPIMHSDKYLPDSYYNKNEFTINDMTNNDILYNAFLDIYEGYLKDHKSVGCTNNSKEFDSSYLKSRIKNIIGKSVKYVLEDFSVPNIYKDNKYIGLWKYDSNSDSFIYNGDCSNKNNNIYYFEIMDLYKVDNNDDTLYLYYHIGFVKYDGGKYILYKDANYKEEVSSSQNVNFDISNLNPYKYTYKLGLCTYDNYCFYKGEWVND